MAPALVAHGRDILGRTLDLADRVRRWVEDLQGLHVVEDEFLHAEASHDLDRLHVVIDLQELGITGYQAADWLRRHHRLDMGLSDHRRVEATLSIADDQASTDRLLAALDELTGAAGSMPTPPPIHLPDPGELDLDPVDVRRDAFFGRTEDVPADQTVGRSRPSRSPQPARHSRGAAR